ncbi:MAG: hypothetical protein A4E64_00253 [Syntrophorhabdus sp. PtaU1.Bin058]|nr:MAG: hypothetical protein A4E64_00253 [Syntrophorhabdus sp. PtaU1.Bin058]
MPRGDGTGPMGQGPMTGRGAGYCTGYNAPGYMNPAWGGGCCRPGMGRGRGRGFAWRNWFYATGLPFRARANQPWGQPQAGAAPMYPPTMSKEAEVEMLRSEAAELETMLTQIKERLEKLSEEK